MNLAFSIRDGLVHFPVWIRDGLVLPKNVIFILGLVLSYAFVKQGAVQVFADFLGDNKYDLWKATMLVNLLEGLSAVLKVAVMHISEAYTGRFKAIIFCTGTYTMGLVLLRVRASALDIVTLIFAVVLIALGTAGEEIMTSFFDYQRSKVKKNDHEIIYLWWSIASITGFLTCLGLGSLSWSLKFEMLSIMMGATWLLFILGIFWYFPEGKPSGSPLTTIYRVFNAAIKNRRLSYPSSEQGYNNEGSNDSEDPLYHRENDEVLLLPLGPPFLSSLDKGAIKNGNEEVVCTAEQVRDVKRLICLIIPLGFTFFAYSLVFVSGSTYFVLQTGNMRSYAIGVFDISIMVLFALKSLVAFIVRTIQSRYKVVGPFWSMGVGIFCSVPCCIAASQVVESRRLSLIKFLKNPDDDIPMSIMNLIPQYFFLGLMEGFAEGGLKTFLSDRLYCESMKKFVEPYIELLLGTGNLWSILFALIFHRWIKDNINHSHLDWYFLVLASLSFVCFVIYISCAKFKFQKPQFVAPEINQETV